jgi:hypothetical protein
MANKLNLVINVFYNNYTVVLAEYMHVEGSKALILFISLSCYKHPKSSLYVSKKLSAVLTAKFRGKRRGKGVLQEEYHKHAKHLCNQPAIARHSRPIFQ